MSWLVMRCTSDVTHRNSCVISTCLLKLKTVWAGCKIPHTCTYAHIFPPLQVQCAALPCYVLSTLTVPVSQHQSVAYLRDLNGWHHNSTVVMDISRCIDSVLSQLWSKCMFVAGLVNNCVALGCSLVVSIPLLTALLSIHVLCVYNH